MGALKEQIASVQGEEGDLLRQLQRAQEEKAKLQSKLDGVTESSAGKEARLREELDAALASKEALEAAKLDMERQANSNRDTSEQLRQALASVQSGLDTEREKKVVSPQ